MNQVHALRNLSTAFGLLAAGFFTACGTGSDGSQADYPAEETSSTQQTLTTVTCGPGAAGDWCGSQANVRGGDPNTLYRCVPNGVATNPRVCAYGCVIHPGSNDTCAPPPPHPYIVGTAVMDIARTGNYDGTGRMYWADDAARGKQGGNRLPATVGPSPTSWVVENSTSGAGSTSGVRCLGGAAGDWCGSQSNVVGGLPNVRKQVAFLIHLAGSGVPAREYWRRGRRYENRGGLQHRCQADTLSGSQHDVVVVRFAQSSCPCRAERVAANV